jgi:hypothetical protein
MLLWKHRKRSPAGSCGLAEKGVACQRVTEEGSIDDQRVPGTVRPSQRGDYLERKGDTVVWGDYTIRAIAGSRDWYRNALVMTALANFRVVGNSEQVRTLRRRPTDVLKSDKACSPRVSQAQIRSVHSSLPRTVLRQVLRFSSRAPQHCLGRAHTRALLR